MQNKFVLIVITTCWAFIANANTADQDDIQSWLDKMATAGHMQTFTGTFVYGKHSELTVMKIYHRADKFGEIERLVSMDGSGREVIRSNNLVTCVLPDKNSVVVEKSRPPSKFPPSFPSKVDKLKFYLFKLKQQDVIAGHLAQKIAVNPVDKYRFGYNIWLDVKTGLLLKSHLITENNKMIEQFLYTNLTYHTQLDESLFKLSVKGKKYTWHQAKESDASLKMETSSFNGWSFKKLPPGFKVGIKRNHMMPKAKKALKHFVISDGLATVSVYVEHHTGEKSDLIGGTSMGAINAYGKHLKGFHVTAVGEVPMLAVKMICESIQQNERK